MVVLFGGMICAKVKNTIVPLLKGLQQSLTIKLCQNVSTNGTTPWKKLLD
tara:strand:- start:288 stop:437 length:150 start_codon:yes stop_codon:yes gene_type:complete